MFRLSKVFVLFFSIYQMYSFGETNKNNGSTKQMHYGSNDQSEDDTCEHFLKFLLVKIEAIQHNIVKLANNEYVKAFAIVFLVIVFFFMICLCSTIFTYKLFEYFH
ncbi:unnamed protein product [Brugia timori]|nr:Bm222, isoform b [Brugia malayi]VDO35696.1 unnamed protein product [Brugia timori]